MTVREGHGSRSWQRLTSGAAYEQDAKPLLPVQGRPLIFHLLDQLEQAGDRIVNIHQQVSKLSALTRDKRYAPADSF